MNAVATLEPVASLPAARPGFSPTRGWLANRGFDLIFVGGTAGLALTAALGLSIEAALFGAILIADLWLLGYHHVIATFARIAFEPGGLKRHRGLVTWVPLLVLAGVAGLAAGVGAWTLPTIYLYWQWWHYTRQSYGIAQMYRLKSGHPGRTLNEMKAVIYILPFAGILHRSYQSPDEFLGVELKTLPIPLIAVEAAAAVTVVALAWWGFRQWRAWRAGELPLAYTFYLLSHLTIFGVGYFAFPSLEHGWLVINVWHNAQYLLIVWLFNNKRFKDQVDPAQKLVSMLSQRRNVVRYFAVTLAVSTVAYITLGGALALASVSALPLAVVVYQVINFHHYIVDSQIWKVRRPEVRTDMGIAQQAA
ncbi:MAG: hypothetical protein GEU75_02190 [Dehalococcoidia bacterium]|nr:hypothetical protein [Dehalococcoidia bacterium]